jgi:hypothetical protein
MGKGTEQRCFFKGRSSNGQKTHEEMFNIPGHKKNVNQNHIAFPPQAGWQWLQFVTVFSLKIPPVLMKIVYLILALLKTNIACTLLDKVLPFFSC